ncbi:MAG: carbohydrate porin [Bryobacteraceae bacterium]|nr:carbohydrate porin [Bryobacteraceae bacterium]
MLLGAAAQTPGGDGRAAASFEHLNLVGAAIRMPGFDDTILGAGTQFRQALASQGLAFRMNSIPRASMNLLDPPAPKSEQAYIGHRPTAIWGVHGILTSDLRQLGLRNAQLHVAFGYRGNTWRPSGPPMFGMTGLHIYKAWGEERVELKAGYHINDLEFIGMQIGGSLAAGAQGVYAVIPYLTGMSFFTLPAPTLNVRVRLPGAFYVKSAAQRSLDPDGAAATARRNATGFRFRPHGNGLLQIHELGFRQAATETRRQKWIRAGLLYNHSRYRNLASGVREHGNHSLYLLADFQVLQPDAGRPARGMFAGGTVMGAPARFNAYHRYWEGRVYWMGPRASRPHDVASIVVARLGHSPARLEALRVEGKPFWEGSSAVTASYSIRLSPGNYLNGALTWTRGAAITPRVADALIANVTWSLFF